MEANGCRCQQAHSVRACAALVRPYFYDAFAPSSSHRLDHGFFGHEFRSHTYATLAYNLPITWSPLRFMMFMVASMAYRQPRIAFITKCARTCHHDTAQGNPVGPQWSIFAADPNVYATETAREYMKNAIFNKWESGTWVISNYTNTGVEKAEVPRRRWRNLNSRFAILGMVGCMLPNLPWKFTLVGV